MMVFMKAAASWKFDYRVFGDRVSTMMVDNIMLVVFECFNDDDLEWIVVVEEVKVEGLCVFEKVMKDFVSCRSVGRVGVLARTLGDLNEMMLDEIDGWGYVMVFFECVDGFWMGF